MFTAIFFVYSAEKDTHDVYREVVGLAGKWSDMCLALGLLPSDKSTIEAADRGNPHGCLQAVVVKWLQKGYDYQRHGPPTWRMLVESVGDPAGGNNCALAEAIAKKHPGMFVHYICTHKFLKFICCQSFPYLFSNKKKCACRDLLCSAPITNV